MGGEEERRTKIGNLRKRILVEVYRQQKMSGQNAKTDKKWTRVEMLE